MKFSSDTAHRPALMGTHHMVASNHYLSSMAGMRILEKGGNAIDAGVAVGLCINVLEFHVAQFGGVAPIMVYPKRTGKIETIAGLGRWPKAISIDFFRQHYDGKLPDGVHRCITPAAPDAWITALDRYGTLSFGEVAQSAIELADNGFPMYGRLVDFMTNVTKRASQWPANKELYLPRGRPPQILDRFYQKDLARTMQRMVEAEQTQAHKGRHEGLMASRDLFYTGDIAREMIDYTRSQGSLMTMEDMAEYHSPVEAPYSANYKGYDVYSCGPWCQGPVVPQALNLLEGIDLKSLGHNSREYLHQLAEAFKLVLSDRDKFYGDPDFVKVPMHGLLSKEYAAERRVLIDADKAYPAMPPHGDPWRWQDEQVKADIKQAPPQPSTVPAFEADTSYVCVVDAEGNAFSATPSDATFDTPVIPGLGFALSSRGQQSWVDPEHTSSLQPGKRPRMTPNPSIVMKDGELFMPFGCPGGDRQTQAMVQVFLNIVEFGMNPQAAIEKPRIWSESFPNSFWPHNYPPGLLCVEGRVPVETRDALAAQGHKIQLELEWAHRSASVCAIMVDRANGALIGGADPRMDAYVIGW